MRLFFYVLFFFIITTSLSAQPQESDQNQTTLSLMFLCAKDTLSITKVSDYIKFDSTYLTIRIFELTEDSITRDISKYSGVLKSVKYVCRFTSYEEGIDRSMRLVIYKKEKEYMVIYFRINKQNTPYLTFHLPMTIPIQKGTFKVTDPENPQLIPIKKSRK